MVSENVNKLLLQANSLSLAERDQLLELLKRQSVQTAAASPDEELAASLAKKGIRLTVPSKRTPEEIERFMAWKPIEMPGRSLSDELIRDRR